MPPLPTAQRGKALVQMALPALNSSKFFSTVLLLLFCFEQNQKSLRLEGIKQNTNTFSKGHKLLILRFPELPGQLLMSTSEPSFIINQKKNIFKNLPLIPASRVEFISF